MIDIGVDQDVGEQAGARIALGQRRRLSACGHDGRFAVLLRHVFEADVLNDSELGRLVMQRLAALFADPFKRIERHLLFVAQIVFDACAWQVLRQSRTPFAGVTLYGNGVDRWRCRDICCGVEQLGLAR